MSKLRLVTVSEDELEILIKESMGCRAAARSGGAREIDQGVI